MSQWYRLLQYPMNPIPLMTEWFFDPGFSQTTVQNLEKYFFGRKFTNYITEACAKLQKQLDNESDKKCAVCFEAVVANPDRARRIYHGRILREAVWWMLLIIYDRDNFEIKIWVGSEENIGAKAAEIHRQLNEQLLKPGIDAVIVERGFDGSLAHTKAAL